MVAEWSGKEAKAWNWSLVEKKGMFDDHRGVLPLGFLDLLKLSYYVTSDHIPHSLGHLTGI